MISDFDVRQLRKMKLQLAAFRRGDLSLGGFIGDMDFLLNAIEDIPLDWKKRVHECVATLEEVYAIASRIRDFVALTSRISLTLHTGYLLIMLSIAKRKQRTISKTTT
jgi:hypothetical protein